MNVLKLSNIVESYVSGDWGNESYSDGKNLKVFCVRGADIIPILNNDFSKIPVRYISQKSYTNRVLKAGDIIIEKSGGSPTQSTGRAVIITEKLIQEKGAIVCSNFCVAIRIKQGWNPFYVFYLWQYLYNSYVFFNFEGKTSGIKNLQLDNALQAIAIEEQPISKQIQIANSIEVFDRKIALNREINRNLEAMARQLYDYWFVQFDFPDENGRPYKSSGGKMVWNEKLKREIPEGWNVLPVNDIASNVRGVSYTKDDLIDAQNGVLVLRGNNIQNNHLVQDGNVAYIPKELISEEQHIQPLDIIMTMSSGSKEHIGKCAMFQTASRDTFGAFLAKFKAKEHYAYLLFNFFLSQYFKEKIKSIASGTGINNLTNQTFDDIYVAIPQYDILIGFDKRATQIYSEIGVIENNNIALTKQRDELLPLLMNGQVNCDLSPD